MEVFQSLDKGTSFIQIDVTGVKKGTIFSNVSYYEHSICRKLGFNTKNIYVCYHVYSLF